jgi:hypothetical protein
MQGIVELLGDIAIPAGAAFFDQTTRKRINLSWIVGQMRTHDR